MTHPASSLCYGVRLHVLGRFLGLFFFILAALIVPVILVALVNADWLPAGAYAAAAVFFLAAGWPLQRLPDPKRIQPNETIAMVCILYLVSSTVMALPMLTMDIAFVDALFESVSGVTTTGLSTLPTVEDKSPTFLFARAWRQWYGGIGIVVFTVALAMRPGLAARDIAVLESEDNQDLVGSTRKQMRNMLRSYIFLTMAAIILIWLASPDFFTALTHALSAVSTGGFSTMDASLAGVANWWFAASVTVASLAGSFPLVMYWRRFSRTPTAEFLRLQAVWIAVLGLASAVGVTVSLRWISGMEWTASLLHGVVTAFSAQSTAGFSSMEMSALPPVAKFFVILSMFIGGGVGSTAGGIKILRFLIALKLLQTLSWRACLAPHGDFRPRMGGRALPDSFFEDALSLIAVYLLVIFLSWGAFLAYGYAPMDSLFEVVSAVGTVGLSAGVCGPDLPVFLKGVLCADMLLGRLEVLAWFILITPCHWTAQRMAK